MKTFRKAVSMLLVVCMAIGCMTVSAFAADEVTTSAFGQSTYPTVSGNYADTVYAKASVDVDKTVTDSGSLVLYSSYGLCTVTNWDMLGGVTKVTSNNPNVATAAITHNGSTLNVAITGVANGTATITVEYCGQTTVNSNQIHSGFNGVANGYIKYTVTVGTGSSGGSTTPDPTPSEGLTVDTQGRYVIYNQADLAAVANDMTASYIVANDIALTGNWTPLGWTDSDDVAFTGTFDGNGYTISGLNADWSSSGGGNVGLFALNGGTIKNLTVSGYAKAAMYIGLLCGQNTENGVIRECTATGNEVATTIGTYDTNSEIAVGGLVGRNDGLIANSCAEVANVKGRNYIGGLVGQNYGTISECYAEGDVNNDYVPNYSTGRAYAGGLVGGNVGTIENSYVNLYLNSHIVRAYNYAGGLVGRDFGGKVKHSYSDGLGHGDNKTGVIGGSNGGIFMGSNAGTVSDSYTISGSTGTSAGATRVSYTNWQNSSWTSSNTNFDFNNVWTYVSGVNDNYPVLRNCGNSGVHEDIVLSSTSTEVTVTFAAGDVRQGDNVTLPTPNPVTVTVPADGKGSLVLEQDASRTSVVNNATWEYRFIGWTDGETVYDLGDTVEVTEDITLNAVWKLYTVDGDKAWTYLDAMAIMDYLAGNVEFYPEQVDVANYDNDDSVSYLDAMAIMDVLAGTTTPTT